MNINSFKPVIDKNSKVLILGSIPSIKSLEKTQYYGNTRNQFWKIIYAMLDKKIDKDYNDRVTFLLKNHIALWDVIKGCYREGSLDSSIKNPEINDFETLFKRYPNIKFIFFNGTKSESLFMRKVDRALLEGKLLFKLPSSSPAWTIPLEEKLKHWMKIKECLNPR
ncbi:DNA-deoxyinosine glycosylase [Wukongibacter baidiensis]|uniref:DNA-deoxyinosine glycosylase n=1 Tax=Wukongibacter baidiensis TaxID=1723361 RepID=UPI003D7FAE11